MRLDQFKPHPTVLTESEPPITAPLKVRRLAPRVPAPYRVVAESGLGRAQDLRELMAAGVHIFLIGGSLCRATDPGAALAELLAVRMEPSS